MNQLRADFKAVFGHWRSSGELSESEAKASMAEAGAAVRANQRNAEWMGCASSHFRGLAEQIERDRARSETIAADVRAKKRTKK